MTKGIKEQKSILRFKIQNADRKVRAHSCKMQIADRNVCAPILCSSLEVGGQHEAQDSVITRVGDVEYAVEPGHAFGSPELRRAAEGLRNEAG
jgi:hypothetical protein